jgi:TRAP-type C4-dicarboxylate transport system permease small subunit
MIVDITLLQSVSYVAAAIGVCIAAFYYALNLRETTKNRREILTNNLLQNLYTEEGQMRFITLFARTALSRN